MIYCSEARKQHNFLRILSFIRIDEVEFNTANFFLPHAGVTEVQNPTLIYLNLFKLI